MEARREADEAHNKWNSEEFAINNLYQAYDHIKELELNKQAHNIELVYGAQRNGEAWKE